MKVKEIMTREVACTDPATSLTAAARLMREHACGVLPVIDPEGHVTGVITDRDICLAVASKGRSPARVPVGEIMSRRVYAAAPDDEAEAALQTMKAHHVRRLPVVDEDGHLKGIISVDDFVLRAGGAVGVRELAIIDALKGICSSKPLVTV